MQKPLRNKSYEEGQVYTDLKTLAATIGRYDDAVGELVTQSGLLESLVDEAYVDEVRAARFALYGALATCPTEAGVPLMDVVLDYHAERRVVEPSAVERLKYRGGSALLRRRRSHRG